jgi:hypothetical protein
LTSAKALRVRLAHKARKATGATKESKAPKATRATLETLAFKDRLENRALPGFPASRAIWDPKGRKETKATRGFRVLQVPVARTA